MPILTAPDQDSRRAPVLLALAAALFVTTTVPAHAAMQEAETPPTAKAEASEAAPTNAADPMAALAHWTGHWQGEGWFRMGPGEPVVIDSEEWVTGKLDGEALLIEGLHHARQGGQVVHHALALLSWDSGAATYRFRTHVVGRGPGDFTGRLEEDDTFVWGGPAGPAGEMRYTIELAGDRWHEVGEFSRDGETWNQFFEMTLRRVGGADGSPPPGERQDP